ncbi:hypothetical protein HQ545_02010 [Candidatus Woesearchaeota archaeon]|nr:hypothetical protein [Candidatus Woesearchaeota archaeon]
MKQAKERFDELMKRAQKGKKVDFGEMEEIFFQLALKKFMTTTTSEHGKSY